MKHVPLFARIVVWVVLVHTTAFSQNTGSTYRTNGKQTGDSTLIYVVHNGEAMVGVQVTTDPVNNGLASSQLTGMDGCTYLRFANDSKPTVQGVRITFPGYVPCIVPANDLRHKKLTVELLPESKTSEPGEAPEFQPIPRAIPEPNFRYIPPHTKQ